MTLSRLPTSMCLAAIACWLSASLPAQEPISRSSSAESWSSVGEWKTSSHWPTCWQHGSFTIYSTISKGQLQSAALPLEQLPNQIATELGVALRSEVICVVVLRNVDEYESYLKRHFPNVPKRRALFIQSRGQGLVVTYFHSNWIEDARHECTHAILHQSGIRLPLWLDEGLAEYFESDHSRSWQHPVHDSAVRAQLRFGQIVQLEELEELRLETLDAKGYRDAWSVVAFLLNHGADGRNALQSYIGDLQKGTAAGFLSRRLSEETRKTWREQYTQFYQAKNADLIGRR